MKKSMLILLVTLAILTLSVSMGAQAAGSQGNYDEAYGEGLRDGTLAASTNAWWGAGSLCTGCLVGGVMPVSLGWGIPLVTAAAGSIPIIAAAATTPQPSPMMMMAMGNKDPQYTSGFLQGYGESQKSKNVTSATLGMGLAVAISIGTILLLSVN